MRVRMVPISFVFSALPAHGARPDSAAGQAGGAQDDRRRDRARQDRAREDRRSTGSSGAQWHRPRHRDAGRPACGGQVGQWNCAGCTPITRAATSRVEVSDDGGGLNRERIIRKAKEKGLIAADAELTDSQGLRPHLHARLFDERSGDRYLRSRCRHGRRAAEYRGAGRQRRDPQHVRSGIEIHHQPAADAGDRRWGRRSWPPANPTSCH